MHRVPVIPQVLYSHNQSLPAGLLFLSVGHVAAMQSLNVLLATSLNLWASIAASDDVLLLLR